VEAFKDHGVIEPRLREGWEQAQADIAALATVGIDLEKSMSQLQSEGVKSFFGSFESLLRVAS
jgi:transaldolase